MSLALVVPAQARMDRTCSQSGTTAMRSFPRGRGWAGPT